MNEVFATMPGNFNSDKVEIQWGTAWWFLDQKRWNGTSNANII